MDLPPGSAGNQLFEITFYLNSADIYFYLDMTASMEGERDNLVSSLTSGNYLAGGGAGIECADSNFNGSTADEEVLKNRGIAGNLACIIRDSQIGAGWFRDIPFRGPNAYGTTIAPYDFPMYGHVQDIAICNADSCPVRAAINTFETRGNYNGPEGGMQGLWAIATGGEVYAGWDRPGIRARQGCGTERWGYPCFRPDAVPIIVHITDAPMQNGPRPTSGSNFLEGGTSGGTTVNYDNNVLDGFTGGTEGTYRQLTGGLGDTFSNAQYIGVVDDKLITYMGETKDLAADVTFDDLGACPSGQTAWNPSDEGGKDAVFRFQVDTPKNLIVSAKGSQFDTALLVTRADAASIDSYGVSWGPSDNDLAAKVWDLGTLNPGVHGTIAGATTGHAAVFARESQGCLSTADADDLEPASVFKFRVSEDLPLRVAARGISSSMKVTASLFSSSVQEPSDVDLNYIYCTGDPSTVNDDCNDNFGDFDLGDLHTGSVTTSLGTTENRGYVRLVQGNTGDESITAAFPADGFVAGGCDDPFYRVSGSQRDAVVDFSLSRTARIRVQSLGQGRGSFSTGWDHALALIERPATIAPIEYNPIDNDIVVDADNPANNALIDEDEVLGLPEGGWIQYVGNSQTLNADYTRSQTTGGTGVCQSGLTGASDAYRDAVFKMVVTRTQPDGSPYSFDFDTFPTNPQFGYKTWLSIQQGVPDASIQKAFSGTNTTWRQFTDDHNPSGGMGLALLSVTEGALNGRSVVAYDMDMRNNNNSLPANSTSTGLGCGTSSGRDALFSFTLAADANVRIRTVDINGNSNGQPDFDTFLAVYRDVVGPADVVTGTGLISGNCSDFPEANQGNAWERTLPLTGGHTYYVLVKQWSNTNLNNNGDDYGLLVEDVAAGSAFIGCDVGSHPNSSQYSKMTRQLAPGTYYITLKGQPPNGSASQMYNYQLNVRPTPPNPPIIECAATPQRTNTIERDLPPGNYSVVIRGLDSSGDYGAYALSIRDLAVAPDAFACHNTYQGVPALTDELPATDAMGNPIDYFLVMRGNQTSGSYEIAIDDVRAATLACDDDSAVLREAGGLGHNAEITTWFDAGEYVAVLKAYDANDTGQWQLSIGDPTLEQPGLFGAKTWLGPAGDGVNGIRDALVSKGVRVITVRSSTASVISDQANTLALATGAVGANGNPLNFTISSDGTGMGAAVIDAVSLLSGNLSMDVGVILKEEPDNPTPNFLFKVEAIDRPGDSCDPPIDTDGDAEGLPDTHINCRPGATPRYKVTLENRAPPFNVPTNPSDPNGGWNMKLQLIGDGTYIVDQIPVYIIPEDVVPDPPTEIFETSGTYEQDINALGCVGNEAPTWKSLQWNATLPGGTKLNWQLCGADTVAELETCTFQSAALVQPGGACVIPEDCPNGYCDDSGVCHYAQGPACNQDADCGVDGACVSGACFWTDSVIDLKPALARGLQGRKLMRVRVVLSSNANRSRAPTIHDWRLNYYCTAQE
jgi:hypothetical protein